jgi:hypothetical protein
MSWREFSYFISGLSGDTPLGRIISIRAEKDPDTVKHMTDDEKAVFDNARDLVEKGIGDNIRTWAFSTNPGNEI